MNGRPRFSVILISHNRADFLTEALDSVAAQTWPASEIFVVDDGSTVDITPATKDRDGLPLTVIRQENAGQQAARNTGAAAASGDWLVFLDDDDQFLPDHLETLAGAIGSGTPDIVFTNFIRFEEGKDEADSFFARFPKHFPPGNLSGGYQHFARWPVEDQAELSIFYPSVMAIRRQHYEALGGFDPRIRGIKCEDMEFTTRATYRSPLALSLKPTVRYRMHEGNSVRDPLKREIGKLRIWDWLRGTLDWNKEERAYLDGLIAERAPHAFRAAFLLKDRAELERAASLLPPFGKLHPKQWLRRLYARIAFPRPGGVQR